MAIYEFDERIKFVLPKNYVYEKEKNEDGEEVISIKIARNESDHEAGEYYFITNVFCSNLPVGADLFEKTLKRQEDVNYVRLKDDPRVILFNIDMSLCFFNTALIKRYNFFANVFISDKSCISLSTQSVIRKDLEKEVLDIYSRMLTILKCVRLDGHKLNLDDLSRQTIKDNISLLIDDEESNEEAHVEPEDPLENLKQLGSVTTREHLGQTITQINIGGTPSQDTPRPQPAVKTQDTPRPQPAVKTQNTPKPQSKPQEEKITIEEARKKMMGNNAGYYLEKFNTMDKNKINTSWNWIAFLFPAEWCLYRKMYPIGVLIIMIEVALLAIPFSFIFRLVGMIIFGIYANFIYRQNIEKKAESAVELKGSDLSLFLEKKGGVNEAFPICAFLFYFALAFVFYSLQS